MGRPGRTFTEQIEVTGDHLVRAVRQLYRQTDTRRVVIRDTRGRELLRMPLAVGLAGGALALFTAPVLAALATIGATLGRVRLDVERDDRPFPDTPPTDRSSSR